MGERVQSHSQVVLQTACTVANAVRAQALFLCSDSPKHVALVEPLLENTTIVLVTRNPENLEEDCPHVKHLIQMPNIDLSRIGQIKLAVLMALSAGIVCGKDRIVCVSGLPRLRHLDNILVLDLGREFELLTTKPMHYVTSAICSARVRRSRASLRLRTDWHRSSRGARKSKRTSRSGGASSKAARWRKRNRSTRSACSGSSRPACPTIAY